MSIFEQQSVPDVYNGLTVTYVQVEASSTQVRESVLYPALVVPPVSHMVPLFSWADKFSGPA